MNWKEANLQPCHSSYLPDFLYISLTSIWFSRWNEDVTKANGEFLDESKSNDNRTKKAIYCSVSNCFSGNLCYKNAWLFKKMYTKLYNLILIPFQKILIWIFWSSHKMRTSGLSEFSQKFIPPSFTHFSP